MPFILIIVFALATGYALGSVHRKDTREAVLGFIASIGAFALLYTVNRHTAYIALAGNVTAFVALQILYALTKNKSR